MASNFVAQNQVKAGQLGVILEALSVHKANAEVAASVAGAIRNICRNGIDQQSSIEYLYVLQSYGDACLLVIQIMMQSLQVHFAKG